MTYLVLSGRLRLAHKRSFNTEGAISVGCLLIYLFGVEDGLIVSHRGLTETGIGRASNHEVTKHETDYAFCGIVIGTIRHEHGMIYYPVCVFKTTPNHTLFEPSPIRKNYL